MDRAEPDPRTQEILRARARALARKPEAADDDPLALEVLEFRLANERYAVETRHVREVQPLRHLTPLPCTPAFVLGVVNLRGRMLPVLDLKEFVGLPKGGITDLHRIIVVGDDTQEFGIVADIGVGVRRMRADSLQPVPATLGGMGADYVRAVTSEHVVVLDMDRILADPRILVDESPHDDKN